MKKVKVFTRFMALMTEPKVSIVIPVYNGEKILNKCLDSLTNLDYQKEKLEIIVVNNNSTDRTKEIIEKYSVKYAFEPKRSRGAARNRGIRESSGEFIAFTDADCVVDKDWIKRLIEGFNSENIAGCGGKVLSYQPKTWVEKHIDSSGLFSQEEHITGKISWLPWSMTNNSIYHRDVLEEVNLFDDNFDTSEDADLSWRILLKGYHIRYVPDAIVWHKRHDTLISLCKQFFGYGVGRTQIYKKYQRISKASLPFSRISIARLSFFDILTELSTFLGMLCGLIRLKLEKISSLELSQLASKIIWWWQDEKVVILNLNNISHYYLEGVGARMWELYQREKDTEKIISVIAEEYDENQEEIREDLISLLNKLGEEELLEK